MSQLVITAGIETGTRIPGYPFRALGVTEFGSFDNSTCKRVLDLLERGNLTLGQVVIKRVAVVELGVNNGSGDGGGCIEVWTDTAKLTDMVIARFGNR